MTNLRQKIWAGTLTAGIISILACGPISQYNEKQAEKFISQYDGIRAENKINHAIAYKSIALASLTLAFPSGIIVYYHNHPEDNPKNKKK